MDLSEISFFCKDLLGKLSWNIILLVLLEGDSFGLNLMGIVSFA